MFPDPNSILDPTQRVAELRRQAEVKRKAAHEMFSLSEPLQDMLKPLVERLSDHQGVWSSRKARNHAAEGRDFLGRMGGMHGWIQGEAERLVREAEAQEAEADALSRASALPG